ncbi:type II secretion system F family protein [Kocuria sp.]|uniref:type II secretion system F family protein n=1 Tax=Kocuria sp. TaxID=1871328 RepID=UPI0026DF44B1|nr:type II secretion system F family protein [Kocuria sp.]MDO5618565.1 type II secretion system F family protein [Kocuria sp.]
MSAALTVGVTVLGVLIGVLGLGLLLTPVGARSRVVKAAGSRPGSEPGRGRGAASGGLSRSGQPHSGQTGGDATTQGHHGDDMGGGLAGTGLLTAVASRILPWRGAQATAEAAEWVVFMRQLGALLRVGRSSLSAFEVAAASLAETQDPTTTGQRIQQVCTTVARAGSVGRAPSTTLQTLSQAPQSKDRRLRRVETSVLADLARCWEVSERTGAPLATLLEGLAEATEADLDAAAARETALAGSRATVRILTWLPVLALGLGMLIGADPIRTLLTTPWGIAAGTVGALLTVIGRVWTGRLVQRAEHATDPTETTHRNRLTRRTARAHAAPARTSPAQTSPGRRNRRASVERPTGVAPREVTS